MTLHPDIAAVLNGDSDGCVEKRLDSFLFVVAERRISGDDT